MGKIKFSNEGRTFINVDKRYLKKDGNKGYYLIENGLIHYFNQRKLYMATKIYSK